MTITSGSPGIGIIGAGWFGERHALAIDRAGSCRLVGACSEAAFDSSRHRREIEIAP